MDGLKTTLSRLLSSDPTCITSRILNAALHLPSLTCPPSLLNSKTVELLGDITSSSTYIKLHTQALLYWSLGYLSLAADTWETLLLSYPFDIMTIRFVNDTYIYLGNRNMLRDSIARVLPIWESSSSSSNRPLKSYLHGMYAFGLGETNMTERAEKEARRGLELNEHDAWATHALVHAMEYTGRTSNGSEFLEKTQQHWRKFDMIESHLDWHWALYALDEDNWEKATEILENYLIQWTDKAITTLNYVDAVSLIYRLKLAGHPYSSKSISALKNFLDDHLYSHRLLFTDFHHYFILNNFDDFQMKTDFIRSLQETFESSDSDHGKVYHQIGKHIFAAIDRFEEGAYAQVVNILYPIRNQIFTIGGSIAQQEVFYLLLIHSAVHSTENEHRQLAKRLINERCQMRGTNKSKMMENYANAIRED
ncbi:unnamed protein product [Rotaria sordida]|uniref:Tetratricopeptide repeat protein 38 n=1 Tax=Rotaria sordida TaxID=392033 RepID=A0A819WF47_9BILA|nr:unnamed protein product [Rotaria sordida]